MGFTVRQTECRTAYLYIETTRELSMTCGPVTEVDGWTKVAVNGDGEVEVEEVEK